MQNIVSQTWRTQRQHGNEFRRTYRFYKAKQYQMTDNVNEGVREPLIKVCCLQRRSKPTERGTELSMF